MYSVQQVVEMYENRKDKFDFGVRTYNAKEAQNIVDILDYYGLILTEYWDSPIDFGDNICNVVIIICDGIDEDDWDIANNYEINCIIDYNTIDFTTLPKDIEFEI